MTAGFKNKTLSERMGKNEAVYACAFSHCPRYCIYGDRIRPEAVQGIAMRQTGPASEMSIFETKTTVTAIFYFSFFPLFLCSSFASHLQHTGIGVSFSFLFGLSPTDQTNDHKKQRETENEERQSQSSPTPTPRVTSRALCPFCSLRAADPHGFMLAMQLSTSPLAACCSSHAGQKLRMPLIASKVK